MVLISIFSFQLKELFLEFFIRQACGDELSQLSTEVFTAPLFPKARFARYSILGWHFFSPFNILNTSSHFLLTYKVTTEKSAFSLLGVSLYIRSCFSLATFKIFCPWLLTIYFNVFWWQPLYVQPIRVILSIKDLSVHFLFGLQEVSCYYSLSKLPVPFFFSAHFGTPIIHKLFSLTMSHKAHRLHSFSFFFLLVPLTG